MSIGAQQKNSRVRGDYSDTLLEAATIIARRCPVLDLQNGYVEVRLIEDVRPDTR
jgi:hypothetical protein